MEMRIEYYDRPVRSRPRCVGPADRSISNVCRNCNKSGHYHTKCTSPIKCFYCKQIGHLKLNCPVLRGPPTQVVKITTEVPCVIVSKVKCSRTTYINSVEPLAKTQDCIKSADPWPKYLGEGDRHRSSKRDINDYLAAGKIVDWRDELPESILDNYRAYKLPALKNRTRSYENIYNSIRPKPDNGFCIWKVILVLGIAVVGGKYLFSRLVSGRQTETLVSKIPYRDCCAITAFGDYNYHSPWD